MGDMSNRLRTLVRHSQSKTHRLLITGSKMEIPIQHSIVPWLDVCMRKLDTDRMRSDCSIVALSRSQSIPESYTGNVVRIHSHGTHAGYVRLIKEDGQTEVAELLYDECRVVGDGETVHGPAILQTKQANTAKLATKKYDLGNSETNMAMYRKMPITDLDLVIAIHSPYWPAEAEEWITRSRARGCLFRSVIKQVVSYGCDFVPVSHKFEEINEWRFSFSKAELLIIGSWRLSQNVVYGILWLIKKKIDVIHTCTYYLKTLMLWACEEKSLDFWSLDTKRLLDHSVRELLINLMMWLKSKSCPNYFIPANNMMDHLIDTDLSRDITELWKYLNSRLDSTCQISSLLQMVTVGILINRRDYELPAWVKRAIVIYDRINNEVDNFADLHQTKFEPNLIAVFRVELSDIYKSLVVQQMANKFNHPFCQQPCNFDISEMYLKCAIRLCESDERDTLENCDIITVRSIQNAYMECPKTNQNEASHWQPTIRSKHGSRYTNRKQTTDTRLASNSKPQQSFISSKESESNIMQGRKITIEERSYGGSVFFKEWPGESPTVNISWFIAKAYLANLYYVTKRDVTSTVAICDDVTIAHMLSYRNERFSERTFPIILSTELACIYDGEIQELIGFYSLSSFVMNEGNSRSAYLGVCPILFVLYVKLRVSQTFTKDERKPIRKEFFRHYLYSCKCDIKVNSGKKILRCAWNNHVRSESKRTRSKNCQHLSKALFDFMFSICDTEI